MSEAKIFGIGLSKTGTTSLYVALNDLDIPTITWRHFREMGLTEWLKGDFTRDYLEGYQGATDLPMGVFYPALDKRYPGSKFILTTRDEDSWLASIRRQFTSKDEPVSGFKRDVRLASYGVSVFNEELFRQIHKKHQQSVFEYFADRPDDFLHMNLFNGDGWEKLCSFLEKTVPRKPFPNVKPGFTPPPQNIHLATDHIAGKTSTVQDPFTFVICLRNPQDRKVKNYQFIENLLEKTVSSLLNQTYSNVHVVVVCHRAPEWAEKYGEQLYILNVSDNAVFLPDTHIHYIDKALRWTIGSLFSLAELGPRYLMLMDADDYVNIHLAQFLIDLDDAKDDVDFYLVDKGVHITLHVCRDHRVRYCRAYTIVDFNKTCGSCRIFRAGRLQKHLQRIDGDILNKFSVWDSPGKNRNIQVPAERIEWLNDVTSGKMRDKDGFFRTLGRHVAQYKHFRYKRIPLLGSAKGCGHGNHDGRRGGEVHWKKVIKRMPTEEFLTLFGLAKNDAVDSRFDGIGEDARYLVHYLFNKIRRSF